MNGSEIKRTLILSCLLFFISYVAIHLHYADSAKGIGDRDFCIITQSKTIEGRTYPPYTMFDFLYANGKNGEMIIVDAHGDVTAFNSKYFSNNQVLLDGTFYTVEVPWNFISNRPAGIYSDFSIVNFARAEMRMIDWLGWTAVLILLAILGAFCITSRWGVDDNHRGGMWVIIVMFGIAALIFIFFSAKKGGSLSEYYEILDKTWITGEAKIIFNEKIIDNIKYKYQFLLPVQYVPLPSLGFTYYAINIVYGPLFLVVHLMGIWMVSFFLPRMPAAFHYAFVSHPAERPVARARSGSSLLPIDGGGLADAMERGWEGRSKLPFVLRNQARRATKVTDQLGAERDLLEAERKIAEATIERERARQRLDQTRRR